MTTPIVPLYGELVSFGQGGTLVTFPAGHSKLLTPNKKRNTKYAMRLGQQYGVDALGGGRASFTQPQLIFEWFISSATSSQDVETQYNVLETQLQATNTDGTSGEVNPLIVHAGDGTTLATCASARCDAVDLVTRGPLHCVLNLTFTLLAPFTTP